MSNEIDDDKIKLLPRSSKQLRQLYGVSGTTWQKYIRSADIPLHIKYYTPLELAKIVNHLGHP